MRVLAIRGAGLASLFARFDVNFTAEPLKGSGLFAITGPTGAGKSTVLDAICLGLYGQYPRSLAAGGEKILDPSGEELAARDEKSILSKGAGSGFAEVDFVGLDGFQYRAGWQVRRARNKPDGRLQKVERTFERIELTGEITPLSNQNKDVDNRVIEATGLTFDQFR